MKILLLDNYDSFTYNLAHYLRDLTGHEIPVIQNDQIGLDEIEAYDAILLSPGPGLPDDAGIMKNLIRRYAPIKKILGVCLGMQAIAEVFGAHLVNLPEVYHGIALNTRILDTHEHLFTGIPKTFSSGRYHSWIVSHDHFPEKLVITAVDDQNRIMALRHEKFDVRGVQFHPESILTSEGMKILSNWLTC